MDTVKIIEDRSNYDDDPDERSINILNDLQPNSTDTVSSSSYGTKPGAKSSNLNEHLIQTTNNFYKKNRTRFIKSAIIIRNESNNIEMNNEESFKTIYSFSKSQTNELEKGLSRTEMPKFRNKDQSQFEKENQRLVRILDTKHLKLRSAKKTNQYEEDSSESENNNSNAETDYDDDDDLESCEGIKKTNNLFRKYMARTEKVRLKKNILHSMFSKAMHNQEKSNRFLVSSMDKNLTSSSNLETRRPKTAVSFTDEASETRRHSNQSKSELINKYYKSMNDRVNKIKLYKNKQRSSSVNEKEKEHASDAAIQKQEEERAERENRENEEQQQRYHVVKELVPEKTHFDFSRNYANRKYSFKIATNGFNSSIEVFKP